MMRFSVSPLEKTDARQGKLSSRVVLKTHSYSIKVGDNYPPEVGLSFSDQSKTNSIYSTYFCAQPIIS